MKKLILIFIMGCQISAFAQPRDIDNWGDLIDYYSQPDKLLHMSAGASIAGIGSRMYANTNPDKPLINAWAVGNVAGAFSGVLKELADAQFGGEVDGGDAQATLYGALIGASVSTLEIYLTRKWRKKKNLQTVDALTGQRVSFEKRH